MKKLLLPIALLLMAAILAGCGPGLVDTQAQRERRVRQITDLQWRMLMDDFDYFMLIEHNSYLTEYHPRIGN